MNHRWLARSARLAPVVTAVSLVALLFISGCEDGNDSVESFFDSDAVDTSGRSISTNRPYISPESVTLDTDGLQAVFTGYEGRGPYEWSVSDGRRGKITVDGYSQALYTRLTSGNNSVTLHDAQGHWATAIVTQPASSTNAAAGD